MNTAIPKTTQPKTNTLETKQTHAPALYFTAPVAPVHDTSFISLFQADHWAAVMSNAT